MVKTANEALLTASSFFCCCHAAHAAFSHQLGPSSSICPAKGRQYRHPRPTRPTGKCANRPHKSIFHIRHHNKGAETILLAGRCRHRGSVGRQPAAQRCCWSDREGQNRQAGASCCIRCAANEAGGSRLGRNTLPFSKLPPPSEVCRRSSWGCKKDGLLSHNFNSVSVGCKIYTGGCVEITE